MQHIRALCSLFLVCFIARITSIIIPVFVPEAMYAIFLLFLSLQMKWINEKNFIPTGDFFLQTLAIYYMPSIINVLNIVDLISKVWVKMLLISLASTIITFAVTAWVVILVGKLITKKSKGALT